jgi:hypothetical protein
MLARNDFNSSDRFRHRLVDYGFLPPWHIGGSVTSLQEHWWK